ncbi:hypothetical protein Xmlh_16035 [Xanthomonas axonopodis pv. melhusii]|uniref:Uncharacterized protein n=1 Tax=Xanthomonas axonopodis pv. melhusii TaxID=487834 RepID=A0A1T1NWS9_9XANT|nr:hypothetical protein Xmlh_16035 [Xanthomonas axonopodis pv. melhusii]
MRLITMKIVLNAAWFGAYRRHGRPQSVADDVDMGWLCGDDRNNKFGGHDRSSDGRVIGGENF